VPLKLQIRSYGLNICEADAPTERKVPYTAVWTFSLKGHHICSCVKSGYREQFEVEFDLMIYVCNFDVSDDHRKIRVKYFLNSVIDETCALFPDGCT